MGNAGADPGDTHYPVIKLNLWFAVSSLFLLVCVVWMIFHDYNREWKKWQREFQHKEAELTKKKLAQYESKEFVDKLTQLNQDIRSSEQALENQKQEIAKLEEVLTEKKAALYNADQFQRKVKADLDWIRYQVEEHRIHNPSTPMARQDEIDSALKTVAKAKENFETSSRELDVATGNLKKLKSNQIKADASYAAATMERDRYSKVLEQLAPTKLSTKIAKTVRDTPLVDFAAPSLKVEKVVLDDLFFDLKFPGAKKKRVDMCMTCHQPIDRVSKDYEIGENPLKSHPRLDLYLTDASPHPMKKVGCTVCHSGSGETLAFIHADHTPRDEKQRKEWEEKYGWEKMHHWEFPMLPKQFTEASCYQCHHNQVEVLKDDAKTLYRAVNLVEKAGCYGCHKIQQGQWMNLRKPGPSLTKLSSKVDPSWAYAWIQKPTDFRPTTWMPQIFHLSNATDATRKHLHIEEREDVAVNAIVEYLWAQSEKFDVPKPPVAGDAKRGEETIQLVGCFACHQVNGLNKANDWNDFGPDLSGIGSKLSEAWLYQWVKNPKKYFPESRMPDLRLSDQDAADIAAYLAGLKKEGWAPKRPDVDQTLLRQLTAEFIDAQVTKSEWDLKFKKAAQDGNADPKTMMLFVGRKFIARQGCFGCHEIGGVNFGDMKLRSFDGETPIGTELTEWGSKDLDKLDFGNFLTEGNVHTIEKTRHEWLTQKLTDPRSFDEGKIKQPDDLLKMPKFRFTAEEIQIVNTLLIGLVKNEIPPQSMPQFSESKKNLADGAFLIRRNNCQACHVFDYEKVTFKHPQDGITSIRGAASYSEDDETYYIQLRETAPSFAADEKGEVGASAPIAKADLISIGPRIGGGLFDSLEKQGSKSYTILDEQGKAHSQPKTGAELEGYAPPSLVGEGRRVQTGWLYDFLKHPYTIRPQVRVKMPTFGFHDNDATTIAQWFVRREEEKYPAEFTRAFRLASKMTRLQLAKACGIGRDDEEAQQIFERLESGGRVTGDTFKKIQAYAASKNFKFDALPKLPFEPVNERSDSYVEAHQKALKGGWDLVNMPSDQGGGGCYTCHWKDGKAQTADPFTWAPDLAKVPQRLRADWTRHWLLSPSQIIPNTKMPKPAIDSDASAKLQPGSFDDRVEAVKDYLMNYERVRPAAGSQ